MLKRIREMFKNEKGLTLVELLAVIVILAIVGAIAFVMIGNIIENSKKDAHVANAMQLVESAKLHDTTGGSEWTTSGTNQELTSTKLIEINELDKLVDPWEKKSDGYTGTVTKDEDGTYSVVLKDIKNKCDISNTEAELIEEGRKVCDGD